MEKSSLDRRFDRILAAEEAGELSSRSGSRALRKLLGNHLAVIGLLIFGIILLASIFAPLLTSHHPPNIGSVPTQQAATCSPAFSMADAFRFWSASAVL